jgi:Ca2+-binding RTX toxin-like protein
MIVQAVDGATPLHYFAIQHIVGNLVGVDAKDKRIEEAPPNTFLNSMFDMSLGENFKVPYQLHASDPNRILAGGRETLYESFNGGDSYFSLGGVFSGRPVPVPGLTGIVLSMAYGSVANPEIAYAGTDSGDIFVRKQADGAFARTQFFAATSIDGPSADDPLDIIVDANDPRRAYAVTKAAVFMTQNMIDWARITDDLNAIALPGSGINLRTIELVNDDTPDPQDDVILVGGLGGVFRRRAVAVAGFKWSEYVSGLPNALVTDMEYDQRSDTLLVGTFGRSAWTLPKVRSTIALESRMQVDGTTGADTIRLVRNGNNPSLLDVFLNNSTTTPSLTVQLSVLQRIQVNGLGGPDILEIQSTNGIVSVQNGIEFLGGNDQSLDTLLLRNTTDTLSAVGQFIPGGIKSSLTGLLAFSGVEAVTIFFGSGSDNFDGSAASIPITLIGGAGADILTGGLKNDTFDSRDGISGNDSLFGGLGNDTAMMDPGDFFNGGPDQDGIFFFGTSGNDHIRISRQVGPNGAQVLVEQKSRCRYSTTWKAKPLVSMPARATITSRWMRASSPGGPSCSANKATIVSMAAH